MSKILRLILLITLSIIVLFSSRPNLSPVTASSMATSARVAPIVETDPIPRDSDAADDAAVWIHPTDPSKSTIIGTDKYGGLAVYNLSGHRLQYLSVGRTNNVDIRYNFLLGGQRTAIVATSNQSKKSIALYRVNAATGQLVDLNSFINLDFTPYGLCMYRSPKGPYYVFATRNPYPYDDPKANNGEVQQWELFDNGSGAISARKVRTFFVGSDSEGCVADDVLQKLYIGETKKGIWKYGAEPQDGNTRQLVSSLGAEQRNPEIEGLTLYYASNNTGYIIASRQCCSEFVIFKREGENEYVATFKIVAGNGIDGVTGTDGIDVSNVFLGDVFPKGVFVAHDSFNDVGANGEEVARQTNFKLVRWDHLANALGLTMDTTWDPRQVGAPVTPTPSPSPTPVTPTPVTPTPVTPTPVTPTPSPTPVTPTPSPTPVTPTPVTPTPSPTPVTPTPVTPTPSPTPVTRTFFPSDDGRVEEAAPTTNYGRDAELRAVASDGRSVESYLRFTVTGLSGSVQSATLRVYATSGTSDAPAVYRTGTDWREDGITWTTRPPRTSNAIDNKATVAADSWVEYNVAPTSDGMRMSAKEGSQPPQLVLTFTTGALDNVVFLPTVQR
jgi:myo-inositol-hexaphosphate 3-phosphohydrolase/outer membrane biosynthesis protein TonB